MGIEISTKELQRVVRHVDIDAIRSRVFKLYEISEGLEAQLQLKKVQKLHSSDESVERYLTCLKQAHDQFLAT